MTETCLKFNYRKVSGIGRAIASGEGNDPTSFKVSQKIVPLPSSKAHFRLQKAGFKALYFPYHSNARRQAIQLNVSLPST
jgi:hypothetical protein